MKRNYILLCCIGIATSAFGTHVDSRTIEWRERQIRAQQFALPTFTGSSVAWHCFKMPGAIPRLGGFAALFGGMIFGAYKAQK